VELDPRVPVGRAPRDDDLDGAAVALPQAPEVAARAVGERCGVPAARAGEHRGPVASARGQNVGGNDRVDAAVDAMQASEGDPVLDGAPGEAEIGDLLEREHEVPRGGGLDELGI